MSEKKNNNPYHVKAPYPHYRDSTNGFSRFCIPQCERVYNIDLVVERRIGHRRASENLLKRDYYLLHRLFEL